MTGETSQELFQQGIAAARKGDLNSAEKNLRECISIDPQHAIAMLNLAMVLISRGDLGAAEQTLLQSVNLQPSIEGLFTLATVLERNKKFDEAEEYLRALLAAAPRHGPALKRHAALAKRRGDDLKAKDLFKQAWDADPADLQAAIEYTVLSFQDDPEKSIRVFDYLLAQNQNSEDSILRILESLLPYKEFLERMRRGLPPYHAGGLNELYFNYANAEFNRFRQLAAKQSAKTDPVSSFRLFTANFCARNYTSSQNALGLLQNHLPDSIWAAVNLSPEFHDKLLSRSDKEIFAGLPAISQLSALPPSDEPVIFLSCNEGYFTDFGAPLIRSAAAKSANTQVHLHLMDANPERLGQIADFLNSQKLRFAFTFEQPGFEKQGTEEAREYYHAIRFVRFYEFLKQRPNALWMMDVDALFNLPPSEMFSIINRNDMAMRIRAGRIEPWNQFSACIVGAVPTSKSLRYFKAVAAYITEFHSRKALRWGIDQLAQFCVFEHLRALGEEPSVSFIPAKIANIDYAEDGVVWLTAGRQKFLSSKTVGQDTQRDKYNALLRKFS